MVMELSFQDKCLENVCSYIKPLTIELENTLKLFIQYIILNMHVCKFSLVQL